METNLRNLFKNYNFYIWPFLVGVIILVLLLKIDQPKIAEIALARQELSGIEERLNKLLTKSQLLGSLDKTKLSNDLTKVSLVLPDGKDAPSILRTLEAGASYSGVLVETIDLAPGKLASGSSVMGAAGQNEIPLRVTINGTKEQIITYLTKITSVGRTLGLKNMELVYNREGTGSAKVNLELAAYFLLSSTASAKIDEALPALSEKENGLLSQILSRELLAPLVVSSSSGKTDLFK